MGERPPLFARTKNLKCSTEHHAPSSPVSVFRLDLQEVNTGHRHTLYFRAIFTSPKLNKEKPSGANAIDFIRFIV